MKKLSLFLVLFCLILSFYNLNSCQQNDETKTTPIWEVFGDTLRFKEHTYNDNRHEIFFSDKGDIIAYADHDQPIDTLLKPIKAKIFRSAVSGKIELIKNIDSKEGIEVYNGVFGINNTGDKMTVYHVGKELKRFIITYKIIENKWKAIDTLTLNIETNFTNLKLSKDGNMLAVFPAITGYAKAYVKTYKYQENKWNSIPDSIYVQDALPTNPQSYGDGMYWNYIDFNLDGSTIVVGNPFAEINGLSSGEVCTYKLQNNKWQSASKTVYGKFPYHHFGSDVSIENNILTVGSHSRKSDENISVFSLKNDSWKEQKSLFASNTFIGEVYDVSTDAQTVLTVIPSQLSNGEKPKELYIYSRLDDQWQLLGKIKNGSRYIKEFQLFPKSNKLVTFQKDFFEQHIVSYKLTKP